jgi:hypothetical protein
MMKMFEIRQSSFQPSRKAIELAKLLTLLTLLVFAAPFGWGETC